MQSAQPLDQLVAGAQVEVIRVAQQNADAEILRKVALGESFDGGLRADRHEHGRLDIAMPGMQDAGAGARDWTFCLDLEADLRHLLIVGSGGLGVVPYAILSSR